LAYEAADAGLLSPQLAAGIRRVKGVKKLGVRLGNWLSATDARALWQSPDAETLKGKRDRAIIAVLLGLQPEATQRAGKSTEKANGFISETCDFATIQFLLHLTLPLLEQFFMTGWFLRWG